MRSITSVKSSSPSWSRREFLGISSVGVLAASFPGIARAQTARQGKAQALSMGYIEGSETLRSLKRLPRALRRPGLEADAETGLRIVRADSIWAGDGELYGRPLRVAIRGLYPPGMAETKQRDQLPRSVHVDAVFPSFDPIDDRPNRFAAWSFEQVGGWSPSPPIRFAFTHEDENPLALVLDVVDAAGVPASYETRFTIDRETGLPRLRRGLYLLGLSAETWAFDASLPALVGPRAAIRYASILMSIELAPEAV